MMRFSKVFVAAFALAALALPAQSFAGEHNGMNGMHGGIGYDKGLYYDSGDGKFTIKQNIQVQFRAEVSDSNRKNSEVETDLMVPRLKFKYGGQAFEQWLRYGVQLAASAGRNGQSDDIKAEDAFIVFAKYPWADLKAGRYKIPYEREVLNSSSELQFVDRSFVREFTIADDRADGISVGGVAAGLVAYRAGAFQRDNEKFSGGDRMLFAGRAQFKICCGDLEYSSGSFTAGGDYRIKPNFAKVHTLSIGVGGFYYTGVGEASYKSLPATGNTLVNRTKQYEATTGGATVDMSAQIDKVNVEAAFYFGADKEVVTSDASLGADNSRGGTGNDADADGSVRRKSLKNYAYRVQAGFMALPNVEIAARWAAANYDKSSTRNDEWRVTGGVNYYIAKHRAKVQADYTFGARENGIRQGKDLRLHAFRAQVQLYL